MSFSHELRAGRFIADWWGKGEAAAEAALVVAFGEVDAETARRIEAAAKDSEASKDLKLVQELRAQARQLHLEGYHGTASERCHQADLIERAARRPS